LWERITKQQPSNLGVRLILFDLALLAKSTEKMARLLEELRGIEGVNGVYWKYAKASRLIQQARPAEKEKLSEESRRQLGQARQSLVEAARRRPSWPRIPALEAEIDELEGNVGAAIEKYQQALNQGETRPTIIRRTVQLLFEQNRTKEANQFIEKHLGEEKTLLSAGLGKLAAEMLISNPDLLARDSERALVFAKKSVSQDSKDYRDHLWLGRFLWATDKPEEKEKAEKSLRYACELAADVPDTWVTLVAFLASDGKKERIEEAKQAIEQAKKKLPADKASLGLAACYENVGDLKKAEEYYEAAVKEAPKDSRRLRAAATFYLRNGQSRKAEKRLSEILSLKDEAAVDDEAMWARRGMAAVLALNPNQPNFKRALSLLESNLKNNPNSQPDRHAKALLLATPFGSRKEAIQLFEELDRLSPLPANELFTLVHLYMTEDQWEMAQQTMIILLNKPEGKNPNYEAYYIRSLLQHGNLADAEAELEKLKRVLPNSLLTRGFEVRVLAAKGQDNEALAIVRDFAKDNPNANLVRVGQMLEELGKNSKARDRYLAEAEEMYRNYTKKSAKPERFLPLAQFLGRQGKIDEALSNCEIAQEKKASPEMVAQVLSNVLREGAAGDEPRRRVEKWIEDQRVQNKDSVPLIICLADVYDYGNRFEEAERFYREALDKDADNVMALNNLAWLLAFKKPSNKHLSEALALINKAIDCIGESPELLDTRGVVYLRMNRIDEALEDLRTVVRRSPSPNRSFHLAFAMLKAKKEREADDVFRTARTNGLDEKMLHPLEKPFYRELERRRKLRAEMNMNPT
jgi:tetratricopeptide (TPR) repeat protein